MNYKFLVIGHSKVGKTTWLNKIINNKYIEEYIPTTEYNEYKTMYNDHNIIFIDKPSSNDINVDGVFYMCDLTKESLLYIENFKKYNTKSVLIINKLEQDNEEFDPEIFRNNNNIDLVSGISIKLEFQLFEPLDKMLSLLNIKTNNENDNIHIFIRKIMNIIFECENDIYKFKIKYTKLCHKKIFLNNNDIKNLIKNINNLLFNKNNIENILDYILKHY